MEPSRALSSVLEPVIGSVYFAPEVHAAFAELGFPGSSGTFAGVAGPEPSAYFCSRAASMGQVTGEVVACAFAVFNPAVVVPMVDIGWQISDASTLARTRVTAVAAALRRVIGPPDATVDRLTEAFRRAAEPCDLAGRPLFAGLIGLGPLEEAWARFHWAGDLLREFRGDSHTMSWSSRGLSACEIGLLSESYWGLPLRSYSRTRGWSDEQYDVAHDRLRGLGWIDDTGLTTRGREEREAIEVATDAQCAPLMARLGDDFDDAVAALTTWSGAMRAAHCYPPAGPQDLADAVSR